VKVRESIDALEVAEETVIEKWEEIEIEDRVMAISARSDAVKYSIYVIQQAAPRYHRKDIVNMVKKNQPEFEHSDFEAIEKQAE